MAFHGHQILLKFLILSSLCQLVTSSELETIIELEDYGKIQGSVMTTFQGREFLAFRGIRYAQPPTGTLRFQAPELFIPQNDTVQPIDATKDGHECLQIDFFSKAVRGQEDCLFLNVYTPNTTDDAKRPVLVYIHGGGFAVCSGSSSQHGPKKILNHDVVFVTINYRLNLFGFFGTENDLSPGNYGLLDQVEALKWIQKYIHSFGGDPDKVTISGESAGAASVLYHVLSPLSTGLFHGVIAMSGTPIAHWAFHAHPLQGAKIIAKLANCPDRDVHTLVTCLKYMPMEMLMTAIINKHPPLVPTVDGKFLTDKPINLLEAGLINKVPIMIGITRNEGALFYMLLFGKTYQNATDAVIRKVVQTMLGYPETQEISTTVVNAIKKIYFDDTRVDGEDGIKITQRIIDIFSDMLFNSPHYQTVLHLINAGVQPFVYSYDYKRLGENNSGLIGIPAEFGVSHVEDLYFLMDSDLYFPGHDDDPEVRKFLDLWINFVKHQNPTPPGYDDQVKWLPAQNGSIPRYRMAIPATLDYYDAENDKTREFWMKEFPEFFNET